MSEMWQETMVAAFREMMTRGVLFLPRLMAMVTFLLLLPLFAGTVSANLAVQEMPFYSDPGLFNVHADAFGNLWFADQHNGDLWRLDAIGNGYKAYHVHEYPFDAVPDSTGKVWWLYETTLNRLDSESAAFQKWDLGPYISPFSAFFGAAIDSSDRVWVTDSGVAEAMM